MPSVHDVMFRVATLDLDPFLRCRTRHRQLIAVGQCPLLGHIFCVRTCSALKERVNPKKLIVTPLLKL